MLPKQAQEDVPGLPGIEALSGALKSDVQTSALRPSVVMIGPIGRQSSVSGLSTPWAFRTQRLRIHGVGTVPAAGGDPRCGVGTVPAQSPVLCQFYVGPVRRWARVQIFKLLVPKKTPKSNFKM